MSRRDGRLETWELRARFAAALSTMYGAEVPAYTTLVEVSGAVNRDFVAAHPDAERLGTLHRVTAERHGAIRVGTPGELTEVADLFAAFGMYPVGYYDLRDAASPVPVVSTAFRPVDAAELAHNPFRVFTSMLATADPRFFGADLRPRVERALAARTLFDPELIAAARVIAADGGCPADAADGFVARAVAAFALSREPIDRAWYDELAAVSAVAADIAGVGSTHINHLTPRVPPAALGRAGCVVAPDVISGAGRAAPFPRNRRWRRRRHVAGQVRGGRSARRCTDTHGPRTL